MGGTLQRLRTTRPVQNIIEPLGVRSRCEARRCQCSSTSRPGPELQRSSQFPAPTSIAATACATSLPCTIAMRRTAGSALNARPLTRAPQSRLLLAGRRAEPGWRRRLCRQSNGVAAPSTAASSPAGATERVEPARPSRPMPARYIGLNGEVDGAPFVPPWSGRLQANSHHVGLEPAVATERLRRLRFARQRAAPNHLRRPVSGPPRSWRLTPRWCPRRTARARSPNPPALRLRGHFDRESNTRVDGLAAALRKIVEIEQLRTQEISSTALPSKARPRSASCTAPRGRSRSQASGRGARKLGVAALPRRIVNSRAAPASPPCPGATLFSQVEKTKSRGQRGPGPGPHLLHANTRRKRPRKKAESAGWRQWQDQVRRPRYGPVAAHRSALAGPTRRTGALPLHQPSFSVPGAILRYGSRCRSPHRHLLRKACRTLARRGVVPPVPHELHRVASIFAVAKHRMHLLRLYIATAQQKSKRPHHVQGPCATIRQRRRSSRPRAPVVPRPAAAVRPKRPAVVPAHTA